MSIKTAFFTTVLHLSFWACPKMHCREVIRLLLSLFLSLSLTLTLLVGEYFFQLFCSTFYVIDVIVCSGCSMKEWGPGLPSWCWIWFCFLQNSCQLLTAVLALFVFQLIQFLQTRIDQVLARKQLVEVNLWFSGNVCQFYSLSFTGVH